MSKATISEEQVLHNELSFEINQELIHLMKRIVEIQQENKQLKDNWNELKKWLGTRINTDKDYEINSHIKEKLQVENYVIKQVMFFIQELEQLKDERG